MTFGLLVALSLAPSGGRAEESPVGDVGAADQDSDPAHTSGPYVLLGVGYPVGGVGGLVGYTLDWGHPRVRASSYLGVGYFGRYKGKSVVATGFGVLGSFGRRHRAYIDLSASNVARATYLGPPEQVTVGWELLVGAGYEVVTVRGFMMRLGAAAGPVFYGAGVPGRYVDWDIGPCIILGWKPW